MTNFPFTITPTPLPPNELKDGVKQLKPDEEGKFSFTVTGMGAPDKAYEVQLQALLVGEDDKRKEVGWLIVGPQPTVRMSGGETKTVTITVRPAATRPAGQSTIKLLVANKDDPNEEFVESSPLSFTVLGPTVPQTPDHAWPKWLLPVIVAGGVVLLGGGGLLIWKLTSKPGLAGLEQACSGDPACDTGLVCVTGKCLMAGGGTCKPDKPDQCASGECNTNVCAIPIGSTCGSGGTTAAPCAKNSTCDPTTKTCRQAVASVECSAGAEQCATDGNGVLTCGTDGKWKTTPCPTSVPKCRDGKCQCSADKGKSCNCSGTIQCDGTCSAPACSSSCVNGRCCVATAGAACGSCNGVVQCDGACSIATPSNLGQSCGDCGGKWTCNGTCSNTTPRCPADFVVAGDQCHSKAETQIHHQVVSAPATPLPAPFRLDTPVSIACGTGHVRSAAVFKRISGAGNCSVAWIDNTNINDCRVRFHMDGLSTGFACELIVTALESRAQCGFNRAILLRRELAPAINK